MRNILPIFLSVVILCTVLVTGACDSSEPEVEIEADFITVGFEDHSTIQLTKGSPEFKEINDEAIRIYQDIFLTAECLIGSEYIEEIKYNNKFVEIEFIEPVVVTTYSDQGEVYKTLELTSAMFVFTGEYARHVLDEGLTTVESPDWGMFLSRRSFGNLEKMVDVLGS